MPVLFAIVGFVLVMATLLDAFEVVLLPRPVRRRLQVNRYFFRWAWAAWSWLASRLTVGRRREDFIGVFGPLSMVSLFGAWALLLIRGDLPATMFPFPLHFFSCATLRRSVMGCPCDPIDKVAVGGSAA